MKPTSTENDLEDITETDFLDSIEDDDFVFVLNSDGQLKTLLMPEMADSNVVPDSVVNMLKFFGVDKLGPETLH